MTSKCSKNKKSGTRGDSQACYYHILTSSVIYYWIDARQHGISLFYVITKQVTAYKAFIYFKILQQREGRPFPTSARTKKRPFDVIYDLYKMKQFHWLLGVAKNYGWSRKITPPVKPDPSVASRGMKTYSKGRIELRNLHILKKLLKKSSQFLSSEQPCEPKSFDVAWKIAGVEKVPLENLWLPST